MNKYNIISNNCQSTLVAKYTPNILKNNSYQSENELEKEFIELLKDLSYEYISIKEEKSLIENLRYQLEKLNNYKFSDNEWNKLFKDIISNSKNSIEDKTRIIQEDYVQVLNLDNGKTKNIYLIDKINIHNNSLQIINQYTFDDGKTKNRYDVTILINGLPLIHIELKRRGIDIKEAFNQVKRYAKNSFSFGNGLFEYIQIFVISNGTYTKYYSNSTRYNQGIQSHNTFEFTSWWSDIENTKIIDLIDFTNTFFAKHSILNLITKYSVFTSDKKLLVLRPYQIAAIEKILNKVSLSYNNQWYGSKKAGGFIWHTTGSGKTLTSFKASCLVSKLEFIDKVLFVVDRKDLDYQTMTEYEKYQKGSANSNANTKILKSQLEQETNDSKIIITTIQKLSVLIKKEKNNPVFNKHIVFIFDECHRSQFGKMHNDIIKSFKKYYIFGFTGTPIFQDNAKNDLKTTEQLFGKQLHIYTIVNAIADKNVLPFKVDYINTIKEKKDIENTKVVGIDTEKALSSVERINKIVEYIIKHFDQKTKRQENYKLQDKQVKGFNSILATSSIETAKKYYIAFKKQLKISPPNKQLEIAIIYSFPMNENIDELDSNIDDEDPENTSNLDQDSRDFLEECIKDYNQTFKVNFDTSSDKFQNYYKDVSRKVKEKQIDLLIVVNMFLTGFDAVCVNTLWVDKNLKMHGLLQAFSRTNRILNSVKVFGNIICFRNLEENTNQALALFGNKDTKSIVLIKPFNYYYVKYTDLVNTLKNNYTINNITSEKQKKEFIKKYNELIKLRNILLSFDEFRSDEILSQREMQDYQSIYIDLYDEFRNKKNYEKENINDDIIFEIELIKQVEISIDYILDLIKKYCKNNYSQEIKTNIYKSIDSSIELRNKKELIQKFIEAISTDKSKDKNIDEEWNLYIKENIISDLNNIIQEEKLKSEETYKFIENSFDNGFVKDTGDDIDKIMPPLSRFDKDNSKIKRKKSILHKLMEFLDKYLNIFKKKYLNK